MVNLGFGRFVRAAFFGHSPEMEEIRYSKEKLGSYYSTLKRARIVALLREKNLLEKFIQEAWPDGGAPVGKHETDPYS